MKKSTFGLLATAALVLTPFAAFAQDSQQNLQINRSDAAAVGVGNYINQTTGQFSNQTQVDVGGYGYDSPSTQTSVQDNASAASAVGAYNAIDQDVHQVNGQSNVDIDTYYPSHYPAHY